MKIGSMTLAAAYAGAAPTYVGLDQVNVLLSHALAGSGNVNLSISAGGALSNVVTLTFR